MPEKSTVPEACHACGQWLLPRAPLRSLPLYVRVWWYIERHPGDACWPWVGSLDFRGYGQIRDDNGRVRKAHQVVLESVLGRPLEPGEWGLHHCDVPACCNPTHLYAGSAADNSRDMWARGRGVTPATARGQANGNSVLTDAQVHDILAVLGTDPPRGTRARLARQYGVTPSIITRIADGRMWSHVRHRPA